MIFCLITLTPVAVSAGDPKARYTRSDYISMWKDQAMLQMQQHGIPASITLAQGILESGDGNSRLARDANNHFGIKCHDWTGKKVYHDDDARNECFRKYDNAKQSFEDHSLFLKRPRYAFLFDLNITDYKAWAKGLKQAGYATNPKYPELLIRIIEENNLAAYDQMAMGNMPKNKPVAKGNTNNKSGSGGDIVVDLGQESKIFLSDNRIKYIVAEAQESPESLARKLNILPGQLRRYNDLEKGETIASGTRVYLQPKRNKAAKASTHIVKQGESMRDISQMYGVKIKKLEKRSGFEPGYDPKPGEEVVLR